MKRILLFWALALIVNVANAQVEYQIYWNIEANNYRDGVLFTTTGQLKFEGDSLMNLNLVNGSNRIIFKSNKKPVEFIINTDMRGKNGTRPEDFYSCSQTNVLKLNQALFGDEGGKYTIQSFSGGCADRDLVNYFQVRTLVKSSGYADKPLIPDPTNPTLQVTKICGNDIALLSAPTFIKSDFLDNEILWEVSSDAINWQRLTKTGKIIQISKKDFIPNDSESGSRYFRVVVNGVGETYSSDLITFYPSLPAKATITPSDPQCAGESGSLSFSNFLLSDNTSYNVVENNLKITLSNLSDLGVRNYTATSNSFKIDNLPSGNWQVLIENSGGACSGVLDTVTILSVPPVLNISHNVVNSTCAGQSATVTSTASGGSGSYTYTLMPSNVKNTTGSFSISTPGDYYVEVSDKNNCTTQTGSFNITIPSSISFTTASTPVSGFGKSDGSISVSASGGTGTYEYQLVNYRSWQSSNVFPNLPKGEYNVQVRTSETCFSTIKPDTVTEPGLLVLRDPIITPVTCNGDNDGTITIKATGGVSPYEYSLTNTFPSANKDGAFTGLSGATYIVYVKDSKGNTASREATVTEPTEINFTATDTDATCNGYTDGTITITASGGAGEYMYSINGREPQASNKFTSVSPGTYSITVSDKNNCSKTITSAVTVGQPATVTVAVASQEVACVGTANGSITFKASGGSGTGYLYKVNNGALQASPTFSGLAAGQYTVTVQDSRGCSGSNSFTIDEPKQVLTIAEDVQLRKNVSCFGGANGRIAVYTTGGTGEIKYKISPSGVENTTGEFNNLTAVTHTITASDASGCSISIVVSLTEPADLALSSAVKHVSYYGGNEGQITLTVTGGTVPYLYSIDNGATYQASNIFDGKPAGTYNIKVKDGNDCEVTGTTTITEPTELDLTITETKDIACFGGNDGQLKINVTGGASPYKILLNGVEVTSVTGTFENLKAEEYTVTVIDANKCEATATTTLKQPARALSFTVGTVMPTCNGSSDGEITLIPSGGTGPYTYSIDGDTYQSGNKFSNLRAGSYSITVKDAAGCTEQDEVVLEEPVVLALTATVTTPISCFGDKDGIIQLNATGGTAAYTYRLTGGSLTGSLINTSGTFSDLAAGTYTINVTDKNGCSTTDTFELTQPSELTASYQVVPVSCYGGNDGKIIIETSGGTGTLRYSLNGVDFKDSNVFEGLLARSYTVFIKDENECIETVTPVVTQPELLTLTLQARTSVSCKGGKDGAITVKAQGGNGSYMYSVDGGGSQASNTFYGLGAGLHQIIVVDAKGCQSAVLEVEIVEPSAALTVQHVAKVDILCAGGKNGSLEIIAAGGWSPFTYSLNGGAANSTGIFNSLGAGDYTVTIRDSKGCTVISNITLDEPEELNLTLSKQDIICYGEATGSITATGTGGKAPYTYSFNGGLYTGTNKFSNILAGLYEVRIKDANGCVKSDTITLVNKYAKIKLTLNSTPPLTCDDKGSIEVVSVEGGLAPYTYSLDGDNYTDKVLFENLSAGEYNVFAKDANGCVGTASISPYGPVSIHATLSSTNISCFDGMDGKIEVQNVSGGNGNYEYSTDGNNFQNSPVFPNLSKGLYTVIVRDRPYSCQSSITVTLTEPAQLAVEANQIINISCSGGGDGLIGVVATGGTGPYEYAINGISKGAETQFSNLPAGDHEILVTDSKGCVATTIITLIQPVPLAVTAEQVQVVSCFGGSDGSIRLEVAGGTKPYIYSINGGAEQTSASFQNLSAGAYSIKVLDYNGCQLDYDVTIAEPEFLSATVVPNMISCSSGSDGRIELKADGGMAPYKYSVTDGASFSSNPVFEGLTAGTYKVVVIDQKNCTWQDEIVLTEPSEITWASQKKDVSCFGGSDGEIMVSAEGGTGALSYSLNGTSWVSTGSFQNLSAGTYEVHIKDENDCAKLFPVSILQPATLNVSLLNKNDVTCYGGNDGGFYANITGGTQPFTITLNGQSESSTSFENLIKGSYTLAVTDALGCSTQMSVVIEEPSQLEVNLSLKQEIGCFGEATGKVSVAATGGVSPYEYSLNGSNFTAVNNFTNLSAGNYQIRVKDANGCVEALSVTLAQPTAPLSLKLISKNDVSCNGGADGALQFMAEGGSADYTYSINGKVITSTVISGLSAGIYKVEVRDANDCSAQFTATVTQPAVLTLNAQVTNPTCFNDCTGEITVNVQGGTAPYTYTWTGKAGLGNNRSIHNLCSGVYNVQVTDAKGCSIQQQFEIINPKQIEIAGIQDTVLCKGQQIVLYAGNPGSSYEWRADNGFTSTESTVTLSRAGNYQLTVTNNLGCSVTKAFRIDESTTLLKAEFLMTSVANVGDTIYVIDVSKPTPAKTEWVLPKGATEIGSNMSGTIKQVTFTEPGLYSVLMTVGLGECADAVQKTITILPKGEVGKARDALGYKEDLIKKFILYPNPTSGQFSALIELSQQHDIKLRLIDFSKNNIIELKEEKDKDTYTCEFNHPELATGVYILSLEAGQQVKSLKVVKF